MKLFKIINVSSNGSFYFQYNVLKTKNSNLFKKKDDKNFKLNQKKSTNKNTFTQSLHYKKKYI